MRKLILLIPVMLIIYFITSIILYVKRHKILEHYKDSFGYLSSFIFAAFLITPLLVGIPMFFDEKEGLQILAPFTLIYCIPALIIYIRTRKHCPKGLKCGMFFAMLGIGLSAPMFVIYKCIVTSIKSAMTNSSETEYYPKQSPYDIDARITIQNSDPYGHSNNSGRIIDQSGSTAGYFDSDSGRITNQSGSTAGYFDNDSGRITNQSGKTTGYFDKNTGRITDSSGNTTGYFDKNTGRITNSSGNTTGYINRN